MGAWRQIVRARALYLGRDPGNVRNRGRHCAGGRRLDCRRDRRRKDCSDQCIRRDSPPSPGSSHTYGTKCGTSSPTAPENRVTPKFVKRDPRIGRPGSGGPRRPDLRRPLLGVNRNLGSRTLQQNRRGQTQRAASDNSNILLAHRHRFFDRDTARSPGKRPAAAAMPVVMDDGLVADALDLQARTRRAEWPQAHRDAKNPVHLRADRHQLGKNFVGRDNRRRNSARAAAKSR